MSRARLLVLALVLAVAAGCGVKGTMAPNAAPETVVFVEGPVDTVNHVVHLRWFGSDVDGQVVRYEYKFIYQAGQEPSGYDSSAWFSTVRKDSIFAVYTPNGYSMPTFVIRSIDDEGIADPTPARQTFQFKNDPPTVTLVGNPILPSTTLPVATINWTSNDPDGDIRLAHYLVWLDANEANATVVPSVTTFTLPPAMFSDGAGGYLAGSHTVNIRAVDDGGAVSAPASFTWNVVAPQGDVLLLDDDPAAQSAAVDPMYVNALDHQLGAGNYTKFDLEFANPFRSAQDLTYGFGLFKAVVWYQENNVARSGTLALAEPAIRAMLAGGGDVYICSQTLVGTNAAIPSQAFLEEIVGADSVRTNLKTLTTNFNISTGAVLRPVAAPFDSLRAVGGSLAVDALVLKSSADAIYLAPPIVMDSTQVEDWLPGVDRVPAGGTGRLVFLTFPLRFLGGTPPNPDGSAGPPPPAPDANYGESTLRKILWYRFQLGNAAP
jgi:hypothetical protein